ncbi:MAG: IS66 family insertion sequence element accessory protein TnpB [bacterium]|nr:IS66 family insertion sequence element accessory protein TnpB [bacterium]
MDLFPECRRALLYSGVTDLRKSINGLSLLVQEALEEDPINGTAYIFCNRGRDKVKILVWDFNGFVLLYKRLEKGCFKIPSQQEKVVLENRHLSWLLEGLDLLLLPNRPSFSFKTYG